MSKLFALLVAAGVGLSVLANAETSLPYPDINDASHATKDVNEFFRVFLSRKACTGPTK
jgi:hypothetical protein